MKNYILLLTLSLVTAMNVSSQTVTDAVRYTEFVPLGTARTVGAGSSFGAMGGDFSVVGINPAGLGAYFKSEFTLSPGYGNYSTTASSQSNISSETSNAFGIDNIGFVTVKKNFVQDSMSRRVAAPWLTKVFAIGLSKSRSFEKEFSYQEKSVGSITERWVQLADGLGVDDLDNFETFPAWDAGAIIQGTDNTYSTDYFDDDVVDKTINVAQSGYLSELSLSWATNYKNKLLLGIGMGIPFVSFEETKTYRESLDINDDNGNPDFKNNLTFTEYLDASGAGFNIKVGAIYNMKPVRIGVAIHTPTWYSLDEDYYKQVDYSYEYFKDPDAGQGSSKSVDGNFGYSLTSPWKFIGSLGTLMDFGKIKGFVNADVEYLNYASTSFDLTSSSDNFNDAQREQELNTKVSEQLGSAVNVRLGGELAYTKYRLRAGYGVSTSPYDGGRNINTISMGTGYRANAFFFDLAYRLSKEYGTYAPYASADESRDIAFDLDSSNARIVATFGFKF